MNETTKRNQGDQIMLKIAICEDDKLQQELLEDHIKTVLLEQSYSIEKYDSGEDLSSAYERGDRYSIIFLDMQMDALNGIQTAEIIREYDPTCIIIIVTSIIEYAVEGYSINAYDFILKPIDNKKIEKVLRSAMNKIKSDFVDAYLIQTRDATTVLKLSDVIYIESRGKKVVFYTENEQYLSNEKISSVEEKLSKLGFARISRYYIVNLNHIKEIGVKSILLTAGYALDYSKNLQREIKVAYMNYMMGDL